MPYYSLPQKKFTYIHTLMICQFEAELDTELKQPGTAVLGAAKFGIADAQVCSAVDGQLPCDDI